MQQNEILKRVSRAQSIERGAFYSMCDELIKWRVQQFRV
jgi:hypothetical protein